MFISAPLYKKLAVGLSVILLSAITGISQAALLYEQSPVDPINGYQADNSTPLLADNVSVAHSNLESISWWGAYFAEDTDDFVVQLYSDLAGTGTLLHDFGSVAVVRTLFTDSASSDYYKYQFALSTPFELAAGSYYLAIQNQGLSSWVWLTGNPGNSSFWNRFPVADWSLFSNQEDLAFRLEGSQIQNAPEPEIMLLLLLGGAMLALSFKLGRKEAV